MSITERHLRNTEQTSNVLHLEDDAGAFQRQIFQHPKKRAVVVVDEYPQVITLAWMQSDVGSQLMRSLKFFYPHGDDHISGHVTQRGSMVRVNGKDEIRDVPDALDHLAQLPGICTQKIVAIMNRLDFSHPDGSSH